VCGLSLSLVTFLPLFSGLDELEWQKKLFSLPALIQTHTCSLILPQHACFMPQNQLAIRTQARNKWHNKKQASKVKRLMFREKAEREHRPSYLCMHIVLIGYIYD
jgi:hypothetical protein